MSFTFSARSVTQLAGVNAALREVATRAIELSEVDFAVIQGMRTAAEQEAAFLSGASQRRTGGKHQIGHAIDTVAYIGSTISWAWPSYPLIAAAFRLASIDLNIPIVWGACWDRTLDSLSDDLIVEVEAYKARRNGKAFIDSGHFELHFSTETTA